MVDSNRYAMTAINKTKFGIYGGQFIPDTPMPAIEELTARHGCCVNEFVVKRSEA